MRGGKRGREGGKRGREASGEEITWLYFFSKSHQVCSTFCTHFLAFSPIKYIKMFPLFFRALRARVLLFLEILATFSRECIFSKISQMFRIRVFLGRYFYPSGMVLFGLFVFFSEEEEIT